MQKYFLYASLSLFKTFPFNKTRFLISSLPYLWTLVLFIYCSNLFKNSPSSQKENHAWQYQKYISHISRWFCVVCTFWAHSLASDISVECHCKLFTLGWFIPMEITREGTFWNFLHTISLNGMKLYQNVFLCFWIFGVKIRMFNFASCLDFW